MSGVVCNGYVNTYCVNADGTSLTNTFMPITTNGSNVAAAYPNTMLINPVAVSSLTSSTSNSTLSFGNFYQKFVWGTATSNWNTGTPMLSFTDSPSNTGAQAVVSFGTASGSEAHPLEVLSGSYSTGRAIMTDVVGGIGLSVPYYSYTGTTSNSSTSVTSVTTTGLFTGMTVMGICITPGTSISSIGSGTITLSKATQSSRCGSGDVLIFTFTSNNVAGGLTPLTPIGTSGGNYPYTGWWYYNTTAGNGAQATRYTVNGGYNEFQYVYYGNGFGAGYTGSIGLQDDVNNVMVWNSNQSDDFCIQTPQSGGGVAACTGANAVMPKSTGVLTLKNPPSVSGVSAKVLYSAAGTALPTCNSAANGLRSVVSDATTPLYMTAYISGGTITAEVICSYNGTTYSWLTH